MPPKYYKKNFVNKKTQNSLETINTNAIYLIIVESPSKCKKIEGFLGSQYCCIASKGHLREIEGLRSIDTKGNFDISFSIIKEKENHIKNMKSVISKFDKKNIYLASDDDREGEAIAWHICEIFNLPIDRTHRLIFHEITKTAIINAIQNPQKINMKLVEAQQARQVLDMIVGFKVSPFLWKYIYSSKDNSLSAGRCQTPALRLIYDNEKEREHIKKDIKYKTSGNFFTKNIIFSLNRDFETEEQVVDFLNKSKKFPNILSLCSPKESIKHAPKPLNTSRLLQLASNLFNLSPKHTMNICQQLYQEGHITYMRTDSIKYSKEFIDKANDYILRTWKPEYKGDTTKLENKNASDPHEAIRVTHIENTHISDKDPKVNSLYHFIWRTTIESCMADAKYNNTKAIISAPDNLQYEYTIETPIFLGYKIVEEKINKTELQNKGSGELFFFESIIKKGSPISYNQIDSVVTIQSRHSHYTEASLIQKLEELGIGRPSTFSMLVETIQDRGYVSKTNIEGELIKCREYKLNNNVLETIEKERVFGNEKNKLVIQPIGILSIEFLINNFNILFSYDYTKNMEDELDIISSRDVQWYEICRTCYNEIKNLSKVISKVEKQTYKIDEIYSLVFQQYGPVLKKTNADGVTEYKNVKKDIKIDLEKLKNGNYTISELIEIENNNLGKYLENDVYLKNGKYGPYIEWGEQKESIKTLNKPLNEITLEDVIPFIEKEENNENGTRLPPPPPNKNILRVVSSNISIRKGKFGVYIYYKTDKMKVPQFFKMTGFKGGFAVCDINELKEWIKNTHNIE
jgi:DNA topoisomerase-1